MKNMSLTSQDLEQIKSIVETSQSQTIEVIQELATEMDRRFEQVDKRFEQIDKRFDSIESRLTSVEKELVKVNQKLAILESRISNLEKLHTSLDKRTDEDVRLALSEISGLKARIDKLEEQLLSKK